MNGSAQHKHTPQQITQFLKGLYSTAVRTYRKSLYYTYLCFKQLCSVATKHFLQLMASTLVCALLLASTYQPGIAQEQSGSTDTQLPSELSQTELSEPGVLSVGMEANYAPYNWTQTNDAHDGVPISNSTGEYANGYDVQVAKRMADALGLKLKIVKMEWDGLSVALQSGKIDAIIAGMTSTPERCKEIDFTHPYYYSDMVMVTKKSGSFAGATSIQDFAGAKVTAQLNTFHYKLIDQIPNVNKQVAFSDFPTMIASVMSGKIDAYVSERPAAMAAVAANSELTFISFADGAGFDTHGIDASTAIGIRKGSKLMEYLNRALDSFAPQQQQTLMQDMVNLNQREQHPSFIDQIAEIWNTYHDQFIRGTFYTVIISFISTFVGFLIGLLIAIYQTIQVSKHHRIRYMLYKSIAVLIRIYIEVFRGTPMMVQAMLIFYGSKLLFNLDLSPLTSAFFIVSVNSGAYLSETVRGGILGVSKGQLEGAHALGLNHWDTMVHIILPQAIISILPSVGNELNMNIKDTSVLNVIAVSELFFITKSIAGTTYQTFQTYLIASVIYFALTFLASLGLKYVEKHIVAPNAYVSSSKA